MYFCPVPWLAITCHARGCISVSSNGEKYSRLLIYRVCAINCVTKYLNVKFTEGIYFVNEVKTQLGEKPLQGNQTKDFHYSENNTSNNALAHTYLLCSGHTVHSDVYLYTNGSQPSLLPEGVFNGIL